MLGRVILHAMTLTAVVVTADSDYCIEDSYGTETSDKVSRMIVVNLYDTDSDVEVPADACLSLLHERHVVGVKASACSTHPWTLKITNLTTIHVHHQFFDLIALNVTISCLFEPKPDQNETIIGTTKKNPHKIGRRSASNIKYGDVTSEYDTVEDVNKEDETAQNANVVKVAPKYNKPSKPSIAKVIVKKSKHGKSKKHSRKVKFVNQNAGKNERRKRSVELDSNSSSISSSSSEEVNDMTNSQQYKFPNNATNVN
ncbi:uncharacterized protein LOC135088395 [Ostrinia nubilalis]|uniref:uncharacterized protein LOC135088395 n=1 Tax=Ostrinia nubilalis TaxID=29057 RepID=UPI0030823E65